MNYTYLQVESRDDIVVLTMNHPETLNAASLKMVEDLLDALGKIELGRLPARVVVLTGAGKAFCSGANLSSGESAVGIDADGKPDAGRPLETHYNPLVMRLRDFPIPILTAVNGPAAGFGSSLALMGDMIVASESGYFIQSFRRIGLAPDGGASYLLARSIGRARAMEMALLGEKIFARQALGWGLINRCVADEDLMPVTLELAGRIADGPESLGPTRRLTWQGLDAGWAEQLQAERASQRIAGKTNDASEGKLSFQERRQPAFRRWGTGTFHSDN